jgi:uncharacterized protein (TIGR02246 family)
MNKILSFVALALTATYSLTAQTSDQQDTRTLMESFRRASQNQDAQAYASLFAESGVWDGPLGQNAIGPANIGKAVDLTFTDFGPVEMVVWQAKPLASDVVLVVAYQKMKYRRADMQHIKDVPVALGSAGPPERSNVRTTIVLRKVDEQWKIVEAQVADLRMRASH